MRISDWSSDVCSSDLLLQAGDLLVDFVDELRHEPDGGLVEQQGLRTGHGQPGNLQHALLAAGQHARGEAPLFFQARVARVEALEGILHAPLVVAHDPATQLQVLLDGPAYEHAVSLEAIDDALAPNVLRLPPDH